ncbi:MAG: DNA translocase FtsK [Syntrophales bacterium]|nr:DNA translocase FtsK [Syntrophales bacterium]
MTTKVPVIKRPWEIKGSLYLFFAFLLFFSIVSYHPADPSFTHFVEGDVKTHNLMGKFGSYLADTLIRILGIGALLMPFICAIVAVRYFRIQGYVLQMSEIGGLGCFLLSLCGLFTLLIGKVRIYGEEMEAGGVIGQGLTLYLAYYFNQTGSFLILGTALLLSLILVFDLSVVRIWEQGRFVAQKLGARIREKMQQQSKKEITLAPSFEMRPSPQKKAKAKEEVPEAQLPFAFSEEEVKYQLPPISLLNQKEKKEGRVKKDTLIANARTLEKTLADFGVEGRVTEIRPGPVITIYELEPAPGVKINRITNLTDDLALALKAASIRIIAPIPGKAAIGIEIPNPERDVVSLREVLDHDTFLASRSKLPIALGVDTVGNPVIADLIRMPHLLIAGTTGSGKSVCLNVMIMSILFKATPEEVKFILIDPKRLELSSYEGIPHLLHPVVTDPKEAALVLRWAVEEMEKRYAIMAEKGVRGIDSYNEIIEKEKTALPRLPYIVIIIDELADLMMVAQRNVEESLARIAQMARASGIHLILATQRPSVDVITGIIKANFPTRISFQVSSKVDSRTILDQLGAEALLGNGDMLFMPPGTSRLTRIHGAYVSDSEIERVVEFVKKQAEPTYDESIGKMEMEEEEGRQGGDYDEKYDEAVALVADLGQASISLIQRYLKVGYNRAARIIERMEAEGIVSKSDGVKPRKVLIRKSPR